VSAEFGELLNVRQPEFVHLGDDVWVNPAHVAMVLPSRAGSAVVFSNGNGHDVARPVLEVLALLTSESEAS